MRAERIHLGLRRAAAWCVDWLVIVTYAGLLVPAGLVLRDRSVELSPAAWNAVAFAVLIVPVTGALTACERGPGAASPGKRLLRLRVRPVDGAPCPGAGRALVRNALKLALPWELGHTAAYLLSAPAPSPMAELVGTGSGILACGLVLGYAVTAFVGSGRTPYDRVAGTRVEVR